MLQINNQTITHTISSSGSWLADITYTPPTLSVPDLSTATWYTLDSLPELSPTYDDALWPNANHTTTTNPVGTPLLTPVSLYASDYGFNTGAVLFRGHFLASTTTPTTITLTLQGGEAFGASVWLNATFLGSFPGTGTAESANITLTLPTTLTAGAPYVFTVLIDTMGLDESGVGTDDAKNPRGILNYSFDTDITWKITGNLGGEDYADRVRGPLNEGGLFAERQGLHQPNPPVSSAPFTTSTSTNSTSSSPFTGLSAPGVAFYTTPFNLSLPSDLYDIPLSLVFTNDSSSTTEPYRALIYVNGYQFGRYTSNVGPQTAFPVAEGVLRYDGENWLGLVVWALGEGGAKVPGLEWSLGATPALTGRGEVVDVEAPAWTERVGAY